MKIVRPLIIASSLFIAGQAQAASTIDPTALAASAPGIYKAFTQDLAAAAWMNPSNSAEPHSAGIIPVGVQIAVEVAGLKIDPNATQWKTINYTESTVPMPRVRLSAGIPFGLDVGYMYLNSTTLDITLKGYEARMAFGNYIPVPMLEANVRFHTSTLTAGDVEVKNTGFAAMIGANLPIIKPYIEVGTVKSTSSGAGAFANLAQLDESNSTMALGAKLELAFFVINAETAKVGDKALTNIKLGFEF
ncbi:MAG: hypothetical protein R8M14_03365 [Ghiorsea sp.]